MLLHSPGGTLASHITIRGMFSESKLKYAEMLTWSAESPMIYTLYIALRSKSVFFEQNAHILPTALHLALPEASFSGPCHRVWVLTCCTLPIIDHQFSV